MHSQNDELEYQLDTLAIRTGHTRSFEGEHAEPIFLTSSFVYENAAEAAAKFSGEVAGNIYSRFTNPTVAMFEKRLAAMDGAERAVATSSGMGAILSVCMAFLKAGDHVICSRAVFGSIVALFEKYIAKFGVDVTFVIHPLKTRHHNDHASIECGAKLTIIDMLDTGFGMTVIGTNRHLSTRH